MLRSTHGSAQEFRYFVKGFSRIGLPGLRNPAKFLQEKSKSHLFRGSLAESVPIAAIKLPEPALQFRAITIHCSNKPAFDAYLVLVLSFTSQQTQCIKRSHTRATISSRLFASYADSLCCASCKIAAHGVDNSRRASHLGGTISTPTIFTFCLGVWPWTK